MKTKKIFISILLLSLLFAGCDDRLEEVNTNPFSSRTISPEYLFSSAVLNTFRGGSNDTQWPFGLQYGHYFSGSVNSRFVDIYNDSFTSSFYNRAFSGFYQGPIREFREVERFTRKGGEYENHAQYSMSKILESYNFIRLVDAFGAVPYFEGGYGQEKILFPKFDSVEDIYKQVLIELENAIEVLQISNGEDAFPGADPMYENDLTKWIKFTNSLRLRLAMRIRFVDEQLAQRIITDCLSKPLIESNDDNAKRDHVKEGKSEFQNTMNYWLTYYNVKASANLVETLKAKSDPRLAIFISPNLDGELVGVPNGLSDEYLTNYEWKNISDPSDALIGLGATTYIMTASEIYLLRAEAALFNLTSEDAQLMYAKGIQTALEQWGINNDAIDAYLASDEGVLVGTDEQKFEQISTQLWISYLPDGHEGWSNIRRTGYPVISQRRAPMHDLGVTNGVLPKRLKYPANEININEANYLKAIEQQGSDDILTPLWWDVRD